MLGLGYLLLGWLLLLWCQPKLYRYQNLAAIAVSEQFKREPCWTSVNRLPQRPRVKRRQLTNRLPVHGVIRAAVPLDRCNTQGVREADNDPSVKAGFLWTASYI
jgi:hypothetical protein